MNKLNNELKREIKQEAEKVFRHLAIDYIVRNDPQEDISQTYSAPVPQVDPLSLVSSVGFQDTINFPSQLQPILSFDTGEILQYEERLCSCSAGGDGNAAGGWAGDARTSMSMKRAPDSKAMGKLLGSVNNVPFLPAGFDGDIEELLRIPTSPSDGGEAGSVDEEQKYLEFETLLSMPPGFEAPIELSELALPVRVSSRERISLEGVDSSSTIVIKEELEEIESGALTRLEQQHQRQQDGGLIVTTREEKKDIAISAEDSKQGVELASTIDEGELKLPQLPAQADPHAKKRVLSKDESFQYAKLLDVTRPPKAYEELLPRMALKFPFTLDPFQQQAVLSMEEGNSVFVAAHTSAGKTVIAEYAVALCQAHRTRIIYTSPIKALSNQKYRDFKNAFNDVGLVTGDIQLHPEASCLIMTTEILRSMLYNGSEAIRELEWVIFDEVHYINDVDRGHVWEEVLIMLPAHVKIAMLSATVPNCLEFADWVGRIKNRTICVIQTMKRPVPLEHYVYTGQDGKTRDNKFKVMGEDGQFLTWSYNKAAESMKPKEVSSSSKTATTKSQSQQRPNQGANWNLNRNKNFGNEKNIYINLIDHLRRADLLPMVVFIFSRKRCDDTAVMLQSVDLTTAKEKSEIQHFFRKCIDRLSLSDKELPQVRQMLEHCLKGLGREGLVAVHHSGILPIIKEVVEILFQRGLVKILFATETFAMGVNMPARTVVFDSIEKFDGVSRRFLTPTEYVQMAGRAGRRGLDSTGTVIILSKGQPPEILNLTKMLCGKAVALESRFRITYGMLLNLSRVEQLRIEDVLQRSFVERASLRQIVSRKEKIRLTREALAKLSNLTCPNCSPLSNREEGPLHEYLELLRGYLAKRGQLHEELASRMDKLFVPGRLVIMSRMKEGLLNQLAVVLKSDCKSTPPRLTLLMGVDDERDFYAKLAEKKRTWERSIMGLNDSEKKWAKESALLTDIAHNNGRLEFVARHSRSEFSSYHVVEDVEARDICAVFKDGLMKAQIDSDGLLDAFRQRQLYPGRRARSPDRQLTQLLKMLELLEKKWSLPDVQLPLLILSDEAVAKSGLAKEVRALRELRSALLDEGPFTGCVRCPEFSPHFEQELEKVRLGEEELRLQYQLSTDSLIMEEERRRRLDILRALGYVDRDGVIELKGKVACEVHEQELLVTELMLENKFANRSCAEIAALLSPITCQFQTKSPTGDNGNREERGSEEKAAQIAGFDAGSVKKVIAQLKKDVLAVARRLDAVQKEYGIYAPLVEDQLSFSIMETAYQWASGTPFADIMELSDAQEGLIVRCIQRLDELCKDVRNAAKIVGDPSLYERMEETSTSIRRDIVFAASLYTSEDV